MSGVKMAPRNVCPKVCPLCPSVPTTETFRCLKNPGNAGQSCGRSSRHGDLKSGGCIPMRVRVPPPAPTRHCSGASLPISPQLGSQAENHDRGGFVRGVRQISMSGFRHRPGLSCIARKCAYTAVLLPVRSIWRNHAQQPFESTTAKCRARRYLGQYLQIYAGGKRCY